MEFTVLSMYGCMVKEDGTDGTSKRNRIYSEYTDLINLKNSNYPSWYSHPLR